MNLFRVHNDPVVSAQQYHDIHVTKIVLEACQMLANCYSKNQLENAPRTQSGSVRKYSHVNHPISKWVKQTSGNFDWTISHALELCKEFEFRKNKKHFCEGFIVWASKHVPELVIDGIETEQPQAFLQHPDCIVNGDTVSGYRKYYIKTKLTFVIRGKTVHAKWTNRNRPDWIP